MTATSASLDVTAPNNTHARLLELSRGYVLARAIHVAADLGVADHVGDAAVGVETLARLTSAQPENLERLLRVLAAHGIFSECAPGQFIATDLSRAMRDDAPQSLRPGLRMVNSAWWSAVGDLGHAVITGRPAFGQRDGSTFFDYLRQHPLDQQRFDAGMACNSQTGDRAVAQAYDFARATSFMDIGGGRGGLVRAILEHHANIHGTLFEQQQVLEHSVLPDAIALEGRWDAIAGNFFETVPAGAALYVIKGVLHDFDDTRCVTILKHVAQAMRSRADSQLLIIERTITPDDKPHQAKTIDLMMMALLGGRERSHGDWQALLQQAELTLVRQIPTASEFTISEVVVS